MTSTFLISPAAVIEYTGKNHHMAIKAALKKSGMFYAVSIADGFCHKRPHAFNVLTKNLMQVAQSEVSLILAAI